MSIIYLIITGFIIGTIVITLGGGGAAFYLGILTTVFGLGPASAAATSLVTSFPSLLIGSYSYFRLHKIKLKIAWRMIILLFRRLSSVRCCLPIFRLRFIPLSLAVSWQFWGFKPCSVNKMVTKSQINGWRQSTV